MHRTTSFGIAFASMGVARSWQLMPADEKAFEEVLSLHLGLLESTGASISTLIRRDLEGCQDGAMQTTLWSMHCDGVAVES